MMLAEILTDQYFKSIIIAGVGGFFINIVNLHQDSKRKPSERTTKDMLYWFMFMVWPIVGLTLGFLYVDAGNKINAFLAFHIGISSPLILQGLCEKVPELNPAPKNAEPR